MTLWRSVAQALGKTRPRPQPSSAAMPGNRMVWKAGGAVPATCPLCRNDRDQTALVEIMLGAVAQQLLGEAQITLVQCPACQVRYAQPNSSVSYSDIDKGADRSALKFYLEQGAGIQSMLEPLRLVDDRPIARYLDIGCSYGFSMDYARRMLGWDVRGYDPGGIALAGKARLGLPIENEYFDRSAATGDFDLVFCSEVIEHIPNPAEYMQLVRGALNPGGMVLLTTPNGDYLRPDMPAEAVLPIISPGHHVILYNDHSLDVLLRQSGFGHTRVFVNNNQLWGAGSDTPFSGDATYFTAGRYEQYLQQVLDERLGGDTLSDGLVYRLLKEATNSSRFDEAQRRYDMLRERYQDRYNFDLEDRENLAFASPITLSFDEFGQRWPYNLAGVWYCRGMIQLLQTQQPQDAAATLMAAMSFGYALRDQLRAIGTDDLETAQLCREAEIARLSALVRFDAEGALDAAAVLRPGPDGPLSERFRAHAERARARLFADLINHGHHALAERLVDGGQAPVDDVLRADDLAAICAWGIYLLTRKGDYVEAGRIFRRVWQAAREQPGRGEMLWTARFHQGLAARYRGDTDKAREVAYEITHPLPEWEPVPKDIACRVDELSAPSA